jgi:heparin binding hemagglutinin HbhA
MAKENAPRGRPTIDDLKDPLLAAVGAVDLALERLNEIIDALRERTEEARGDARTRAEETRDRLTKFREDLPTRREELREQLSGEELRKTYQSLVERGEAALERLRTQTTKAAPAKRAPAKKAPAKKAPAKKATRK